MAPDSLDAIIAEMRDFAYHAAGPTLGPAITLWADRLAALQAQQGKAAFTAGYHCQWIKAEQRYIFDPLMKPGDPEGAFKAWTFQVWSGEAR